MEGNSDREAMLSPGGGFKKAVAGGIKMGWTTVGLRFYAVVVV
jgi:hypothetical protein